ncbi:pentapeptide repeat-containing protein [Sciscionella marina]|uniref:pentapeptide repeat-containing protein n=1 Tax=Sciscionella marina TaxID=508770 RepID=UPI0012F64F56|nr:pentapeptide repeat-containing protein [Sciscionella marina]
MLLVTCAAVLLTIAVGGGLVWWIEASWLPADRRMSGVLDAVKIGLSVGAGSGGVFALYLAWRRQRAIEADHDRQERALAQQRSAAAATERDAEARRINELYTSAVDQIGSDKAAVRLGGIYALERLAQEITGQRKTIVNVLCAYLRMPYDPDGAAGERQVRIAAQRVLAKHLSPGSEFWPEMSLDLDGATLIDFTLSGCELADASFVDAQFVGDCVFDGTEFAGDIRFDEAEFHGSSSFARAEFRYSVLFNNTKFNGTTGFSGCEFHSCSFGGAVFLDYANFSGDGSKTVTRFRGIADFSRADFGGHAVFWDSDFRYDARFSNATMRGISDFSGTVFHANAFFDNVMFTHESRFRRTTFHAGESGNAVAVFGHSLFRRGADFDNAVFHAAAQFEQTVFYRGGSFNGATFDREVPENIRAFLP